MALAVMASELLGLRGTQLASGGQGVACSHAGDAILRQPGVQLTRGAAVLEEPVPAGGRPAVSV